MNASDRRRLALALEALDDRARRLLALSRLEGLEVPEIAGLVRMSPASVAKELGLAERALKRAATPPTPERRRA